jgi:internalin A
MTSPRSTETDEHLPVPAAQQRCFHWRLYLALFLIVGAVGSTVWWLGAEVRRARTERDAVAAIRELGGHVYYDLKRDDFGNDIGATEPSSPAWLYALFGEHLFAPAVSAELCTTEQMQYVSALARLRRLRLHRQPFSFHGVVRGGAYHGTTIAELDLPEIVELTQLEELDCAFVDLTDAAIDTVVRLPRLRFLNLTCTCVTDAALDQLGQLRALEELGLGGTVVTDDGMKTIASFRLLRTLGLASTRISDAGVRHLASLPCLETLDVQNTQVTSLKEIRVLVHLREVRVDASLLTDASLRDLASLPSLERLDLQCADEVTDAGLRVLSEYRSLKSLSMGHMNDARAKALGDVTGLEELTILYPDLTDVGTRTLTNFGRLRTLRSPMQLTATQVEQFAAMRSLRVFDLSGGSIRDVPVEQLAKLTQLEELDLTDNSLGSLDVDRIRRLLPNCRVLVEVSQSSECILQK